MQSYNNTEVVKIDENVANTYVYDNFNTGNIPILNDGHVTPVYETLNALAH